MRPGGPAAWPEMGSFRLNAWSDTQPDSAAAIAPAEDRRSQTGRSISGRLVRGPSVKPRGAGCRGPDAYRSVSLNTARRVLRLSTQTRADRMASTITTRGPRTWVNSTELRL